jgi:hypothetical protein
LGRSVGADRRDRVRTAEAIRDQGGTATIEGIAPKATVEGRLPHGVGIAGLFYAPIAWSTSSSSAR